MPRMSRTTLASLGLRFSTRMCLAVLAGGMAVAGGCVERTIHITSDPSGALVHLNDEEVGRTPVTVPFTFYGVYSVRLTQEPRWVSPAEAATLLGRDESELLAMVERGDLQTRQPPGASSALGVTDDEVAAAKIPTIEVPVYYRPLWVKQKASAPLWDYPGVDLLAEAVPNNAVALKWHYVLEPTLPADPEVLVEHARQMRGLVPSGATKPQR